MTIRLAAVRITLLALAAALAACSASDSISPPPTVTGVASVTLTPEATTAVAGVQILLSAVALDADGNRVVVPLSWSSSNPAVATVLDGVVIAISPGTTTIGVTAGSKTASFLLTVTGLPPALSLTAHLTTIDIDSAGSASPVDSIRVLSNATTNLGHLTVGAVTFTGSSPIHWLTASLNSDHTPATLTLTPTGGAFPTGNYFATVPITTGDSTGAMSGGVNVFVTLHVGLSQADGYAQVSGGSLFLCMRKGNGSLLCSGQNTYGQLGTGDLLARATPTPAATGFHFSDMSAGVDFTCGVSSGAPYCWGHNDHGQLGDGTTTDRLAPTPVGVPAGVQFTQVRSGGSIGCALAQSGAVYCWGDQFHLPQAFLPPGAGNATFTQLSVGNLHVCALTSAGDGYCWGDNTVGETGSGNVLTAYTTPTIVASGLHFTQINAGLDGQTCGLTTAGAAWCWGWNGDQALGTGAGSGSFRSPAKVLGGLTYTDISAGDRETCGIVTGGAVYCWGDISSDTNVPILVSGPLSYAHLVAGRMRAAIDSDRFGYVWVSSSTSPVRW